MRKLSITLSVVLTMLLSMNCSRNLTNATSQESENTPSGQAKYEPRLVGTESVAALPHAVIYKTSGDFANNVAVRLSETTPRRLIYFPGVGDISEESRPLPVANGFLLDRQGGIGSGTAFLDYTFEQYHALMTTPSPSEIMQHIIPDAVVTQIHVLPITLNEALSTGCLKNPAVLDSLLRQ